MLTKTEESEAMVSICDTPSPRLRASCAAYESSECFSRQSKLQVVEERIQPVSWKSIRKQALLGKGAFSEVHRVYIDAPEFSDKKYALKHLSAKITDQKTDFDLAAIDLATEANLLSRLKHDNIITLHGIYGGDLKSSYTDCEKGYFLLLDHLHDTLPKRLERERSKEKRRRILTDSISKSRMMSRIKNIALGVSRGLEYLHDQQVLFRDLKPDNVGFTKEGKPVIFDFGFAREVHTLKNDEIAGSLRYMSPEMAYGKNPSLPSDVYSFGVLLFELCSLQKPFKQFKDPREFEENVFTEKYRPSTESIPSKEIKDLITTCWNADHTERPEMSSVVKILRVEAALAITKTKPLKFQPTMRRNSMGANNFRWKSSQAEDTTNADHGSHRSMHRRSTIPKQDEFSPASGSSSVESNDAFPRSASMHAGELSSSLSHHRQMRRGSASMSTSVLSGEATSSSLTNITINEGSNYDHVIPDSNTDRSFSVAAMSTTSSSSDLTTSSFQEHASDHHQHQHKPLDFFPLGKLRKPLMRKPLMRRLSMKN